MPLIITPSAPPAPTFAAGMIPVFQQMPPMPPMPAMPMAPAPAATNDYLVYRCAPTLQHPFEHWKFYPSTMNQQDLPDIRVARPLYVWSTATGQYTPVTQIQVAY